MTVRIFGQLHQSIKAECTTRVRPIEMIENQYPGSSAERQPPHVILNRTPCLQSGIVGPRAESPTGGDVRRQIFRDKAAQVDEAGLLKSPFPKLVKEDFPQQGFAGAGWAGEQSAGTTILNQICQAGQNLFMSRTGEIARVIPRAGKTERGGSWVASGHGVNGFRGGALRHCN